MSDTKQTAFTPVHSMYLFIGISLSVFLTRPISYFLIYIFQFFSRKNVLYDTI